MFALRAPTPQALDALVADFQKIALTYATPGITRDGNAPARFAVDHNRALLGHGQQVFERAVAAMRRWAMFEIAWLALERRNTPIQPGEIVAVIPKHFGFVSINPCRIVYVVNENTSEYARFGFGYGTLPGHVGRGEERFLIEWQRADDSVHYDIFAVSQPGTLLTWLGYPVMRLMQRRFARASKAAMQRAVAT
jgi:uncharacterized protein (UPF0548 family)